jgi:hypothetical protein
MSEKADFEPSLKRASHFVKIILACPHRLPKLPESTLRKQATPNNGSLFCSHCGLAKMACRFGLVVSACDVPEKYKPTFLLICAIYGPILIWLQP